MVPVRFPLLFERLAQALREFPQNNTKRFPSVPVTVPAEIQRSPIQNHDFWAAPGLLFIILKERPGAGGRVGRRRASKILLVL